MEKRDIVIGTVLTALVLSNILLFMQLQQPRMHANCLTADNYSIKIFYGRHASEIESEINDWLNAIAPIRIYQIDTIKYPLEYLYNTATNIDSVKYGLMIIFIYLEG